MLRRVWIVTRWEVKERRSSIFAKGTTGIVRILTTFGFQIRSQNSESFTSLCATSIEEMRLSTFLLPFLPLVLAEELRVFHRIHHPAASSPSPFLERGSLSLTSTGASLVPHETLAEDLLELAEVSHGLDGAFYQVALEREGDEHEGHWAISSVKAVCIQQLYRTRVHN